MEDIDVVANFGRNVKFTPAHRCVPKTDSDILELLDAYRTSQIRVAGSLHAWSGLAATDVVLVDMRHFASISPAEPAKRAGDRFLVTVGGGCQLGRLLNILRTRDNLTLPTVGAVTEQTIAGAISTGTHGSGLSSLSHYVRELMVAAYDRDGRPTIHRWNGGSQELRAARCGLGCTGIIVSVTVECVPVHHVSERVAIHGDLESVLRAEDEDPLQEFALVPYLWKYVVYRRRVSATGPPPARGPFSRAFWYRVYKFVLVDLFFHISLKGALFPYTSPDSRLARWSDRLVRFTFMSTPMLIKPGSWLTAGKGAVDRSDLALTRKHHYFRHLEMEVFVPARHIAEATALLQAVTAVFADQAAEVPPAVRAQLDKVDLLEPLESHRGRYTHHYPLYFRRVMPDDTLISMTSGAEEPYYAIGFFSYTKRRRRYYEFARFIAVCVMKLYDARLHWGKYIPMFPQPPLTRRDFEPLYPAMGAFRDVCRQVDPNGVFRNEFTHRVLGLETGPAAVPAPAGPAACNHPETAVQ